jgi:hypothetical protein
MMMDDSITSGSANISEAIETLTVLRESVIATNAALEGDLTALAGVVDTLIADNESSNTALNEMVVNVQAGFAGVETAIRDALDGLVRYIISTF